MNRNTLTNFQEQSFKSSHVQMDQSFIRMVEYIFNIKSEEANNLIGSTDHERRNSKVVSDGGYKCIHLNPSEFIFDLINLIKVLKLDKNKISKMKFIDVGCGIGQKIFLARHFGFDAYGLELRQELISVGRMLVSRFFNWRDDGYNRFIKGDALQFENYHEYDIIYFYCPLFDTQLEMEMEHRIAEKAKPGTIVIPYLTKYFGLSNEELSTNLTNWSSKWNYKTCIPSSIPPFVVPPPSSFYGWQCKSTENVHYFIKT